MFSLSPLDFTWQIGQKGTREANEEIDALKDGKMTDIFHTAFRIHILMITISLFWLHFQCSINWQPFAWFIVLLRTDNTWWRHQMETFSVLLDICAGNSPVTGEFPSQRPVTRSFDVFFDLRLNKRLSKQSRSWWFETLSLPLWRHCNEAPKTNDDQIHQCVYVSPWGPYIDGLVQERRNSSALAMELRLFCTNPSIYSHGIISVWISNRMLTKLWYEILIHSQTSTAAPLGFWERITFFIKHFVKDVITYPCWY